MLAFLCGDQIKAQVTQEWVRRFDGTANLHDFTYGITSDDAGNVYITGSTATATQGSLEWLQTYNNPSVNGSDRAVAAAVDELGNVYVTGLSLGSGTMFDFATVKYTQQSKLVQGLRSKLELLMAGLLNEAKNDTVKNIVFASCSLSVDSLYFIRFDTLIAQSQRSGLDLKDRMNAGVISYYNLDPGTDYISNTLKTIRLRGFPIMPILTVPAFHSHTPASLTADPFLSYGFDEADYPIPCLNCAGNQINRSQAETVLTFTGLIIVPPWTYSRDWVHITNCVARLDLDHAFRCLVCPPNTTLDGIPQTQGYNLQNHEIEIQLGTNGNPGDDLCYYNGIYTANPPPPNPPQSSSFGKLSVINGSLYYYRRNVTPDYARILKVKKPIVDRGFWGNNYQSVSNWLDGHVLSLCNDITLFNSIDEINVRYALGMGGVYRLDRPGINQQPLYFAFPYSKGLWFNQGPDMRVYYGTNHTSNNCPSGHIEITQQYETRGCEFCQYYPVWNVNQSDITDYLASTDYNFITGYWFDNVITVSFMTGTGNRALNANVLDYTASFSPPFCTPPNTPLLARLTIIPVGNSYEYEVLKEFDNSLTYPPGTTFTIHVQAKYANGEIINECRNITLAASINPYSHITVQIRGNILDYDPFSVDVIYQIDVY